MMKCTRCDSADVIDGLRVVDRGEDNAKRDLELEIQLNPNALVLKRSVSAAVSASICGSCGHVMFSVDRARIADLRAAAEVMKATRNFGGFTKHPLFKEFVREESARKHLNLEDQVRQFAAWLRNRRSIQ